MRKDSMPSLFPPSPPLAFITRSQSGFSAKGTAGNLDLARAGGGHVPPPVS
jgi:hypothetical protein